MMELISVIIPAYNVDRYLERCLDSICGQSYQNLEIIIIEDGSTDKTPEICDRYARSDSRIKVFHKKNEGVAAARNDALDIATGERLAFSDADDCYESDMLERLNVAMNMYNADMVTCGYYEENTDLVEKHGSLDKTVLFDKTEAYKDYFKMGGYIGSGCWNKLIKAKAIGNIRFKNYRKGEDVEWISRVLDSCNIVVCLDYVGYHYIHRGESTTRYGFSKSNLDVLCVSDEIVDFIRKKHPHLLRDAYAFHAAWYSAQIQWMYWFGGKNKHVYEDKYIRRGVISNLKHYICNPYIVKADKLYIYGYILGCYRPIKCLYDKLSALKKRNI